jgi:pilus assembly protein Flp/PilA
MWIQTAYAKADTAFRSFINREEGQGLVEYALILSLVAVVAMIVLTLLGTDVVNVFDDVEDKLGGSQG